MFVCLNLIGCGFVGKANIDTIDVCLPTLLHDLRECFYELTYFADKIKPNEEIKEISLKLGFETLDYLLGVINNK